MVPYGLSGAWDGLMLGREREESRGSTSIREGFGTHRSEWWRLGGAVVGQWRKLEVAWEACCGEGVWEWVVGEEKGW